MMQSQFPYHLLIVSEKLKEPDIQYSWLLPAELENLGLAGLNNQLTPSQKKKKNIGGGRIKLSASFKKGSCQMFTSSG